MTDTDTDEMVIRIPESAVDTALGAIEARMLSLEHDPGDTEAALDDLSEAYRQFAQVEVMEHLGYRVERGDVDRTGHGGLIKFPSETAHIRGPYMLTDVYGRVPSEEEFLKETDSELYEDRFGDDQ